MINSLHLNILSNFSEISKFLVPHELVDQNLLLVANDLGSFYKLGDRVNKSKYKEKYEEFKKKKLYEIEIQEIMMRIGLNLSKCEDCCKHLLKNSYFFQDIIDYLKEFCSLENNKKVGNKKDFIEMIIEKKKSKHNVENINKIMISIMQNTVDILLNAILKENDFIESFFDKVIII